MAKLLIELNPGNPANNDIGKTTVEIECIDNKYVKISLTIIGIDGVIPTKDVYEAIVECDDLFSLIRYLMLIFEGHLESTGETKLPGKFRFAMLGPVPPNREFQYLRIKLDSISRIGFTYKLSVDWFTEGKRKPCDGINVHLDQIRDWIKRLREFYKNCCMCGE